MVKTNKKAQMKINQMAFMLIAVTIFLAMVGMFILMIRIGNLKATASELEQQNAVLLASKLANSPEFSCGEAFGTQRANCVDFDKVMMLKNNMEKYEEFWGVSNLELKIVYPRRHRNVECTQESYRSTGCDNILLIEKPVSGYDVSTYVTVCRKEIRGDFMQDVCNLGKIFVRYENVQ